jgi:hypothetical protein
MEINMRKVLILLLLITTVSCSTNNIQQFEQVDQSSKTVLVSTGSLGFQPRLKRILRDEGFKLYIKSEDKDFAYAKKGNVKYELIANAEVLEYDIFTGQNKYVFDISFINLETGTEVFYYSGQEWAKKIDKRFRKLIKNTYTYE